MDPLSFWSEQGQVALPVLAGVAARVLAVPAESASVEQLLSASGRVATTARASLSNSHINELYCLHQWLMGESVMRSLTSEQQAAKSSKSTRRYAYLSLRSEGDDGDDDDESTVE